MKTFAFILVAVGLFAQPERDTSESVAVAAPAPAAKPAPQAKDISEPAATTANQPKGESFHYNVNWPSGLSLGEAELTSSPAEGGQSFSFRLDASVPGFAIEEFAKSRATTSFCSIELTKEGIRGKRKVNERTEFDASKMTATRTTDGGGKSELSTASCAKDALTFVHFIRRELAAGRLPSQQKVYYGGAYSVHVTFAGTQRVTIGGQAVEADKLTAAIKGPVTEVTAELFFEKDPTRKLVLVQVPLKVGTFTMEIDR